MSTLSVRLPDSLHHRVRTLAHKDGISINQFVATAVAEKLAALDTVDYLRERAARANLNDFDRVLDMVPDVEPDETDQLPSKKRGSKK